LQIKPNGVDVITASKVCFGIGMFNYMVSMIPPLFRWIIELLGFDGNRDVALKELNRTATELLPSPRATWAKMALIGLQWFFLEVEFYLLCSSFLFFLLNFPSAAKR